mgnify:CR=1 FL=1
MPTIESIDDIKAEIARLTGVLQSAPNKIAELQAKLKPLIMAKNRAEHDAAVPALNATRSR